MQQSLHRKRNPKRIALTRVTSRALQFGVAPVTSKQQYAIARVEYLFRAQHLLVRLSATAVERSAFTAFMATAAVPLPHHDRCDLKT